jgi:microcystin-dependent protein
MPGLTLSRANNKAPIRVAHAAIQCKFKEEINVDPFLGEIRLLGFGWAPNGWALCDGSLLAIAQNTALFSLLGTTYGGNGTTTFALPDLRGRVPVGQGQGPGMSPITMGQVGGEPAHTLLGNEIPPHSHPVNAAQNASTTNPSGAVMANDSRGTLVNIYAGQADGTVMNPAMVGPNSGGAPHNNMQPFLGMNYCIALQGIYPSRP